MKIKRYNNFSINEKVDQDDQYEIEQILAELTQDHSFNLEIRERFYDVAKLDHSSRVDNTYRIPALELYLYKSGSDVDISRSEMENILSLSYECVGKLSDEFDDVQISNLEFNIDASDYHLGNKIKSSSIRVKFIVFIKSEVKVSDKEGFYDFRDFLSRRWRGFDNKVTRSFKEDEVNSESMLFKHTGESNATLSEFKRLVDKIFEPRYYQAVRLVYEYECKKEGDDIRIVYNGKKNVDRRGNLIQ